MLLNKTAGDVGKQFVKDVTYEAVVQKVMNATVMLKGTTKKKDSFTGSAAILGPGKEVVYKDQKWKVNDNKHFTVLISALHNLEVYSAEGLPLDHNRITWKQDYAEDFKKKVLIEYGNKQGNMDFGSNPGSEAKIDHVVPIFQSNVEAPGKMITIKSTASQEGKQFQLLNLRGATSPDGKSSGGANDGITPVSGQEANSWAYDVVLLLSGNEALYQYAITPGKCDYMDIDLEKLSKILINNWKDNVSATPVMQRSFRLAQFGYGDIRDTTVSVKTGTGTTTRPEGAGAGAVYQRLQYKCSTALSAQTADSFFIKTNQKVQNGYLVAEHAGGLFLDCDGGNNSTFVGDSGGPLLAFSRMQVQPVKSAYLVGVNYGAGLATSEDDARNDKVWEYDNNVATSLGFFYEKLFDLRFQNV